MTLDILPPQLRERANILQTIDPDAQTIPYRRQHWVTYIGNDEDFAYIVETYPDTISRGNIAAIARKAHATKDKVWIRRLFLATMIWGYGTVGYGPYRTLHMINAPQALDILQTTFMLISTNNLLAAYQQFRLSKCGPAFFTKYFYFIGMGHDYRPLPLVLDSVVARTLEEWLHLEISQFARVVRNKQGRITALGYHSQGYYKYVHLMNTWAQSLGCRADSIELLLFSQPSATFPAGLT